MRWRYIAGAGITLIVLALSALLPPGLARLESAGGLWPRESVNESYVPMELSTLSDRAKCYGMYSSKEIPFTQVDSMNVSERAREVLRKLEELFKIDFGQKEQLLHTGEYYYEIEYGKDGETMNLIEYYREWNADWKNWIKVILDADTGDLYYVYASSGYLRDRKSYTPAGDMPKDVDSFLARFAEITGLRHVETRELLASEGLYEAEFSDSESSVVYSVKFIYAEAALMDVKLTIRAGD